MKASYLVALFRGTVSAVKPLVGRDDGSTTVVVYVTSKYTITKCAANIANCPAASTTESFMSTTVMSVTTTICLVTSATPGGLPTANMDTLSDSITTSYPPEYTWVSSIHVSPVPSSANPSDISVSLVSPNPFLPVTTVSVSLSASPNLPPQTSALPTGSLSFGKITPSRPVDSLRDSIPTYFPVSLSASTVDYAPIQPLSSAGSGSTPGTYIDVIPSNGSTTSGVHVQPYAPSDTATDAVPTSGYSDSPSSSNADAVPTSLYLGFSTSTASTSTDAVPTPGYPNWPVSSNTDAVPTSGNPGSSVSTNTNTVPATGDSSFSTPITFTGTDAVPTSGYPSSSSPTSSTSTGAIPTSGYPVSSSTISTGPVSTITNAISTSSMTYPAVTSIASSDLVYPVYTSPRSTPVNDGTTKITSHLIPTSTRYLTTPLPGSSTLATETDAVPTSGATGHLPSGSGYHYPSNSANGTIVTPTPSYIEVPVNMGQMVAAGQNPIAAIVVSFAFALFA